MGQAGSRGSGRRALTLIRYALLSAMIVAVQGCSRSGPEFAPAGGLVTLDGKPLADAGVMFTPVRGGPVASATTDHDGRFTLRTLTNDGALVGEHAISVSKGHTEVTQVANSPMPLMRYIPELPQKYTRRETSELTATVDADASKNDFALALTSK